MTRKAVVTGLGATTPIGGSVTELWDSALAGVSGVSALTQDWVDTFDFPTRIAAAVSTPAAEVLDRVTAKRLDPSGQLSLISAREAWADAGFSGADAELSEEVDPDRLAVAFGTGIGGAWTLLDAWDTLRERGARRVMPMTVPMLMPNGNAATIGMALKARAAAITSVSACASGTESFYQALMLIQSGKADVVVAGGGESANHPVNFAAFGAMQALSRRNDEPERASRPYDIDRDGFVMAEGAGAVVIESEEFAKARGARIYCELAGTGVSADAYHLTAPDEAGTGAARALREALAEADASPSDVIHINAHATSTPKGDIPEAIAMRAALGDAMDGIPVSATKSMTGHMLGGSGAVEAILTIKALTERTAPRTINLENQDPAIDLDVVTQPRTLRSGDALALSNSFGFGGHNAVVAFRSI